MKPRNTAAAIVIALVAAIAPGAAFADPGSTVKADVVQLQGDIDAAHTTLIADLSAITTDAQNADTAQLAADINRFRTDRAAFVGTIGADRTTLESDLQAAKTAGVSGLGTIVRPAIKTDLTALRQIRRAALQAREAVVALRHPGSG